MSLNHYSKGAVVSFLHHYVAGIRLLDDGPGYRRFRIAPMPGGGLTWARARHECPYGEIEAAWALRDGQLMLDVVVPPGTSAEVWLPDGRRFEALPGATHFSGRAPAATA
jgi:alpha-L-rhamnosidase